MKRVLLAGATSDIGFELAKELSDKGYELVLLGRDEQKLRRLGGSLKGPANYHVMSASEFQHDLSSLIEGISETRNGLYGLISLLGYLKPEPLRTATRTSWLEVLNVNLLANLDLIQGFAKSTQLAGETRKIVMFSSVASIRGDLGLASYSASKAALESLVRSAALELATRRITVNAIRLGLMGLGMGDDIRSKIGSDGFSNLAKRYPLGIGEGVEVLGAVNFMLSQESNWMTGATLSLDGGYSLT